MRYTSRFLFGLVLLFVPFSVLAQGVQVSSLGDETDCVALIAGQHIEVGSVCASVEGENVEITYATHSGWYLLETHLWAGLSITGMPQTRNGNPQLGRFPYNSGDLDGVTEFTVSVPLSVFGLSGTLTSCDPVLGYIVSHAVVEKEVSPGVFQNETAYGDGSRLVERGNWATWFSIVLECSEDNGNGDGPLGCETAFAYGDELAVCFIESPYINTARWGWHNGPVGPGSYTFDIYAAAGQCDLWRGTHVGELQVEYNGSSAVVTYELFYGFALTETHLYVGNDPLPTNNGSYTIAPGQFGNINYLDFEYEDAFVIENLSGNIYVVAHAVVCSSMF